MTLRLLREYGGDRGRLVEVSGRVIGKVWLRELRTPRRWEWRWIGGAPAGSSDSLRGAVEALEDAKRRSDTLQRSLRDLAATLAVTLALGCAWGNADWRRDSYAAAVELVGAGDGRCSSPAPWTSFRACVLHDAPYELARRERCAGRDSAEHTSEQARFAADATLLQQMALDGYGELWSTLYYLGVRLGAWWTWHFGPCARDPPPIQPESGSP